MKKLLIKVDNEEPLILEGDDMKLDFYVENVKAEIDGEIVIVNQWKTLTVTYKIHNER
jgi:hypothetical protein